MDVVEAVLRVEGIALVNHNRGLTDRLPQGGIGDIEVVGVEVATRRLAVLDRVVVAVDVEPCSVVIVVGVVHGVPSAVVELHMGNRHIA